MARIRTIKPEFWQDEDIALLDAQVQLLAIGLLNHADDEGYFKAHPALIKAVVFPYADNSLNIHGMLTELSNVGYLRLFEGSDRKKYGEVIGFSKHQKVNRPTPSKIKGLEPITDNSVSPHEELLAGKEQGTGNMSKGEKGQTAPSSVDDYAFVGQKFNINQKDFESHKTLYPNLNLLTEYPQLDSELRDIPNKEVWIKLNAKLNYRNKNTKNQQPQSKRREL